MNILEEGFTVVLHSPSGDTDIMVLALALISDLTNVFMDYGNGKNRKRLSLGEIRLLQRGMTISLPYSERARSIVGRLQKAVKPFSRLSMNLELTGK